MLLALDTSTRQAGIALYDGDRGLVAEHHWHAGRQHTVELMPEVTHLLEQAHLAPASLTAIAVALGPGSFTGVRVALAAGKGLALALAIPLLGIPTLDVIAYPHQAQPYPVIAAVQAGRGRICWASYGRSAQGWGAQTPYALATVQELARSLEYKAVFVGELTPADQAILAARAGNRAFCLPPALAMRRAGCLAEMAWARLKTGERDDPASLRPIYVQEPISQPSAAGGEA